MSRSKIRKADASDNLQMENLEEKRLLTTTPINVPQTPMDSSAYVAEIDTLAKQELVVREHLAANAETNYLQKGDSGLQLVEVKYGAAGIYNRFMQTWQGIEVYDSWVTVNQKYDGTVQQVYHDGHDNIDSQTLKTMPGAIDAMMAERSALKNLGADSTFADSRSQLVWNLGEKDQASLTWQITVYADAPLGDWLTLVDAQTNKVIHQENRMAFATGNGDAFVPNPWQTQGDGTGLDDNDDATSTALEAQHIDVTLLGLDDGTGLLIGEFVDLATLNSTTLPDIDADETDRQYYYDRDDERFEQVVVYHSVDSINRYFHTLGFDDDSGATMNGIRDFPTLANAHWDNADNSFYSTGDDAIHFGDGGVDDAEDADIVAHEYGHAIQHNQNAAWGGGEMGAMGEGFGDYLAASFYFDNGDAAYQATDAACVGEWDATSYSSTDPPCLRRVDGNKMYPDDTGGGVHADGEIWSRALWDIRAALGGPTADQIILESHFSVPGGATMPVGAEHVLLADQNLNGGANAVEIRQAFIDRGILEPLPTEGTVTLNQGTYNETDTIEVTVVDSNVVGSTVTVDITVTSGDVETLTLADQGSGVYFATINTIPGTPTGNDGDLQVVLDDVVDVTYNDTDDGTGNPSTSTASAVISTIVKYSSNVVMDIDSANPTTLSTIEVPDVALVGDLNVVLDITHTFAADLDVFLIAPDGTRVELFTDVGGGGDNFTDTTLDDEATETIGSGTAPFTGSFQPEGSLADLIGTSIAGTWTLEITDDAGGDVGTLNSWAICIETTDAGEGSVALDRDIYALADSVEIRVVDGNAVDPVTVDVTSTSGDIETVTLVDQGLGVFTATLPNTTDPVMANDGTLQVAVGDTIEVTYQDLDDGSGSPATVMDTAEVADLRKFESGTVSVPINDNAASTSTINITDNGLVGDLDVRIHLDHTFTGDLDVALIAPDGTRVELIDRVGGNGDNFHDTVLDDEATTAIGSGSAPFTGSFIPAESLGNIDGASITGTWRLEITDNAGGDTGVLNDWTLCISVIPDPSIQSVEVVGPATIVETDTGSLAAVFNIVRDMPDGFRRVDYQTVDGTATAGSDYTATSGTAMFGLFETTFTVSVPVSDDFIAEDLESFSLVLSNAVNMNIEVGTAVAEIQDNDFYVGGELIDFGSQASPVEPLAIGVVDLTYNPTHGFGWDTGGVNLVGNDSGVGSDVQRDNVSFDSGSFLIDVANPALYEVTVEFGDNDSARESTVVIEGQSYGTVTTVAGEFSSQTYIVEVTDGQITIDMTGGTNGGAVTSMQIDTPISLDPFASKFLDGDIISGTLSDISESDDTYLVIDPPPTTNLFKQKIDVILLAETTELDPTSLGFRLEASMNGGPAGDVTQNIRLWDQQNKVWEEMDTRPATDTDSVVEVMADGDLTRFVHPTTGEVLSRIVWESPEFVGTPFNWTVNVDEAGWLVAGSSSFAKSGSSNSDGVAQAAGEMTKPEIGGSKDDSFTGRSGAAFDSIVAAAELASFNDAFHSDKDVVDVRDRADDRMLVEHRRSEELSITKIDLFTLDRAFEDAAF